MSQTVTDWNRQRRAKRGECGNQADRLFALATAHARAGRLRQASHALLLAQRLLRLETAFAQRRRQRETAAATATATATVQAAARPVAPPPPKPQYPSFTPEEEKAAYDRIRKVAAERAPRALGEQK